MRRVDSVEPQNQESVPDTKNKRENYYGPDVNVAPLEGSGQHVSSEEK